jgi:hypothetical protein
MPAEKTVMFPAINPLRDLGRFAKSTYPIDAKLVDGQQSIAPIGAPGPGDDVIKQVGGGFRPAPRTTVSGNISEPFDGSSGRTDKYFNSRLSNTVRGEVLEP